MDCPVCNYKGIPASATKCPGCGADLTVYHDLSQLESGLRLHRNIIILLSALLLVSLLVLGYMFLFSDGLSSRYTRLEMQGKNNEIIDLKKKNSQLQKQILNMEKRMLAAGIIVDTSTSEYQKVIPSPGAQETTQQPVTTSPEGSGHKTRLQKQWERTESDEPTVTYYTVKAGETLYSIAKAHYGNGNQYRKIMKDNNIKDPSNVKVGMRLKIIK